MTNPGLWTPFAAPEICSSLSTTTVLSYTYATHISPFSVVIPDEADPRYTSCNPPGWNALQTGPDRFFFSPAVCPSDWTAYSISATNGINRATCCPSGYTCGQAALTNLLAPGYGSIPGFSGNLCSRTLTSTASSWVAATTTTAPQPSETGSSAPPLLSTPPSSQLQYSTKIMFQVLNGYTIEWKDSDRASLSPQPPSLMCTLRARTTSYESWDPKLPAPTVSCYDYTSRREDKPILDSKYVPMVIVFSIMGAIVVALLATWFSKSRRKRRLAREEARVAGMNHELGVVVPAPAKGVR